MSAGTGTAALHPSAPPIGRRRGGGRPGPKALVVAAGTLVCTALVTVGVPGPSYARSSPSPEARHRSTVVIDGCTVVLRPTRSDFTNCPNEDLSQANFYGLDLRFANFAGSSFAQRNCQGSFGRTTYCPGADLDHANLDHADVANADFFYSNFVAIELAVSAASLSGASMRQVEGSNAWFGDLSGLDLRRSDLTGAILSRNVGTNLTDANLSHVREEVLTMDFTDATLRGANFDGAEVGGGSSFTGAALSSRTQFVNADISSDDFTGTRLIPADRTVPSTSPSGAVVRWKTPKALPGATPGACSPPSGSQFPVGTTTVRCTIEGTPGLPNVGGPNDATGTFTVTVQRA